MLSERVPVAEPDTSKVPDELVEYLGVLKSVLGFVSTESLHRHIIKNYSEFLYRNLFFEDGDETKPIYSDAKKYEAQIKMGEIEGDEETVSVDARQKTELSTACYEAVKGLGLRVKYPKYKKRANPVRKPSAAQIAAKLGG